MQAIFSPHDRARTGITPPDGCTEPSSNRRLVPISCLAADHWAHRGANVAPATLSGRGWVLQHCLGGEWCRHCLHAKVDERPCFTVQGMLITVVPRKQPSLMSSARVGTDQFVASLLGEYSNSTSRGLLSLWSCGGTEARVVLGACPTLGSEVGAAESAESESCSN